MFAAPSQNPLETFLSTVDSQFSLPWSESGGILVVILIGSLFIYIPVFINIALKKGVIQSVESFGVLTVSILFGLIPLGFIATIYVWWMQLKLSIAR